MHYELNSGKYIYIKSKFTAEVEELSTLGAGREGKLVRAQHAGQ